MNIEALKLIMAQRDLTKSDIARMARLSRQAVSLWFQKSTEEQFINIHTSNLILLANALDVKVEKFINVPEVLSDQNKVDELSVRFLWDKMYVNLENFLCACVRGEPKALARLVENFGMFASAKIAGNAVWKKFDRLKKWLHPIRRKECEQIWNLQKNLKLI
jgi:transcriptional regulator with XRE-family HTH domain